MNNQISEARLAYEIIMGRVSDSHWYRVKKLLKKHRLDISVKNVQFFANIRQLIPRSAIGVDGILDCYQKVEEILGKSNRVFRGSDVVELLRGYGIKPHQTTISRWFKPLGGYRKNKQYSPEKLKSVFVSAFLYKAHTSVGLPEDMNHG
jgi:hypothetical protein